MRSIWRNILVLSVAAAYLAVVTLGHHFHNHGSAGQACHEFSDGCHTCATHGHHGTADEKNNEGSIPPNSLDASVLPASGNCPICNFFSHHGATVVADEIPSSNRLELFTFRPSIPILLRTCNGPQQPRAPPLLG